MAVALRMKLKLIASSFVILASASVAFADEPEACEQYCSAWNLERAFEYCSKSADSGDAWAKSALGLMYRNGRFANPNNQNAVRLSEAAARQSFYLR